MSTNATAFNQNFTPIAPTLKDVLDTFAENLLINFNCHHLATIQTFDIAKQTATATINYQKTYFVLNDATQTYEPNLVAYSMLLDCPVICLGGGLGALTFPIQKGDECLVLFNDRDIDNWYAGSTTAGVATPRLHSFSDGIILVGVRSLNHSLTNYDPKRSILRGKAGVIGVNTDNSKVLVSNATPSVGGGGQLTYSTTLNTLLAQLIDNVKDLVTAVNAITVTSPVIVPSTPFSGSTTSGTPNNGAAISAVTTELTTTASAIAALLE